MEEKIAVPPLVPNLKNSSQECIRIIGDMFAGLEMKENVEGVGNKLSVI